MTWPHPWMHLLASSDLLIELCNFFTWLYTLFSLYPIDSHSSHRAQNWIIYFNFTLVALVSKQSSQGTLQRKVITFSLCSVEKTSNNKHSSTDGLSYRRSETCSYRAKTRKDWKNKDREMHGEWKRKLISTQSSLQFMCPASHLHWVSVWKILHTTTHATVIWTFLTGPYPVPWKTNWNPWFFSTISFAVWVCHKPTSSSHSCGGMWPTLLYKFVLVHWFAGIHLCTGLFRSHHNISIRLTLAYREVDLMSPDYPGSVTVKRA